MVFAKPSASVYRRTNAYTSSVYGLTPSGKKKDTCDPCVCESTVDPIMSLTNFLNFLNLLYGALQTFYVADNVNSPLVAFMSVNGAMKFSLFVRLTWSKQNPGVSFDPKSRIDINALKDIYLSYNRDWHADKFLVTQTIYLESLSA